MATSIRGPGLVPSPGQNPDLVPTGVLAGTTRALVPAPTGDARGADLVVGVAVGATAVHPCQTVADTLATGQTLTRTTVWVCLG